MTSILLAIAGVLMAIWFLIVLLYRLLMWSIRRLPTYR